MSIVRGSKRGLLLLAAVACLAAVVVGTSTAGESARVGQGPINIRISAGWRTFDFQLDNNGGVGRLLPYA